MSDYILYYTAFVFLSLGYLTQCVFIYLVVSVWVQAYEYKWLKRSEVSTSFPRSGIIGSCHLTWVLRTKFPYASRIASILYHYKIYPAFKGWFFLSTYINSKSKVQENKIICSVIHKVWLEATQPAPVFIWSFTIMFNSVGN